MEVYVQSCGSAVDQDYSWQKIADGNRSEKVESPSTIKGVNQFIQKDAPSIFIGRNASQLIFFISNLESTKRFDHVRRKIRNSILCITNSPDEELLIRGVAARALADIDLFATEIDQAVSFSSHENGFAVDYQAFQQLLAQNLVNVGNMSALTGCKIGKNSSKLRLDLADEILQHKLPKRGEVLVVVTQYQDPKLFKKVKVWRGLSSLFPEDTWQDNSPNIYIYSGFAIAGVGLFALIAWILIKPSESTLEPGSYLRILANGNEQMRLYNTPDVNAESFEAAPHTLIKVIEERKKWVRVKICELPRSVSGSSEHIDTYRDKKWIYVDNFKEGIQKEIYQVVDKKDNGC